MVVMLGARDGTGEGKWALEPQCPSGGHSLLLGAGIVEFDYCLV